MKVPQVLFQLFIWWNLPVFHVELCNSDFPIRKWKGQLRSLKKAGPFRKIKAAEKVLYSDHVI